MATLPLEAAIKCSKNILAAELQLEVNLRIADHCIRQGTDPDLYVQNARLLLKSLALFRHNRDALLGDLSEDIAPGGSSTGEHPT